MMHIEFESDKMKVLLGEHLVYEFIVSDRYQSNGHKKPKNMAIRMKTFSPIHGFAGYPCADNATSIELVVGYLKNMEIDADPFIDLCIKRGWNGSLENMKDQMSMQL